MIGSHRYVEAPNSGYKLLRHTARVGVDPCILHYVNCGYDQWRVKYQESNNNPEIPNNPEQSRIPRLNTIPHLRKVIGPFPDRWFGKVLIPLDFHLKSRDAIHYEEESQAQRLYENVILFDDQDEVKSLPNPIALILTLILILILTLTLTLTRGQIPPQERYSHTFQGTQRIHQ